MQQPSGDPRRPGTFTSPAVKRAPGRGCHGRSIQGQRRHSACRCTAPRLGRMLPDLMPRAAASLRQLFLIPDAAAGQHAAGQLHDREALWQMVAGRIKRVAMWIGESFFRHGGISLLSGLRPQRVGWRRWSVFWCRRMRSAKRPGTAAKRRQPRQDKILAFRVPVTRCQLNQ